MKILLVNKYLYPKGGAETYMLELARHLEAVGHEVAFFGMHDDNNIVGPDREALVWNMDFHASGPAKLLYPFKIIYSFEAKRKLRRMLRDFRPDVMHVNNYNYQLTPSILDAPELRDVAVIQTVHDPQMVCPYHRLYNERTYEICEKCTGRRYTACLRERCFGGSFIRSLLGMMEGTLYKWRHTYEKKIDCYIFPSRFLHDKTREMGLVLPRCEVLHNFTDIGFDPSGIEKKDQVIYFGRLSREKGFLTILKAADLLPGVKFVVAGGGPLEGELAKHPNIEYVGFKRGEELFRLVGESLVSLYPAEWYENCPLSIIESMMAGTPVIGANAGGIPELIREGEDGAYCEAGSAESIRDQILWFYENRDEARAFAQNAIRNAARFNIAAYMKRLEEIYEEQVALKKGRAAAR